MRGARGARDVRAFWVVCVCVFLLLEIEKRGYIVIAWRVRQLGFELNCCRAMQVNQIVFTVRTNKQTNADA